MKKIVLSMLILVFYLGTGNYARAESYSFTNFNFLVPYQGFVVHNNTSATIYVTVGNESVSVSPNSVLTNYSYVPSTPNIVQISSTLQNFGYSDWFGNSGSTSNGQVTYTTTTYYYYSVTITESLLPL